MRTRKFELACVTLVVTLGLVSAACSKPAGASEKPQVECITALSSEQRAQFQEVIDEEMRVVSETPQANGTSDICVIEEQPDGSTKQRVSNGNDGFPDYLLYGMLFGYGRNMATFAMLNGDITPMQYLFLSNYAHVGSSGGLFRPYSCGVLGCPYGQPYTWNRDPQPIVNQTNQRIRVTNIQYGNQTPRAYTGGKLPKAPKGYTAPKVTKAANKVADLRVDPSGKPAISTLKNVKASDIQSGKKQLPPNSVKSVSPPTTLARSQKQGVPLQNNTPPVGGPVTTLKQGATATTISLNAPPVTQAPVATSPPVTKGPVVTSPPVTQAPFKPPITAAPAKSPSSPTRRK